MDNIYYDGNLFKCYDVVQRNLCSLLYVHLVAVAMLIHRDDPMAFQSAFVPRGICTHLPPTYRSIKVTGGFAMSHPHRTNVGPTEWGDQVCVICVWLSTDRWMGWECWVLILCRRSAGKRTTRGLCFCVAILHKGFYLLPSLSIRH